MGRRQGALLLLTASCAVASATSAGCHKQADDAKNDAKIVVGVEAQPAIVSRIGKVHYTASVGPASLVDKEIVPKPDISPFPLEIDLASPPGSNVEVKIEAFGAGPNNTIAATPMLVRTLAAPFVAGSPMLARVKLESSCLTGTPGFKGPTCPANQSCSNGRCIDPTLLAEDLEPYAKDWAKNRPDACKAAHPTAAASVVIGTGQTDYVALKDGDVLTPEKGPQGGHHLWIAVRLQSLRQVGSTVTITAEQPGTQLRVPPTSFVFPFEPADRGYCKLYGLRLQLDNSAVPVQKFLGQPLDIHVNVRDTDGVTAGGQVHVNVGATTIGD